MALFIDSTCSPLSYSFDTDAGNTAWPIIKSIPHPWSKIAVANEGRVAVRNGLLLRLSSWSNVGVTCTCMGIEREDG